MSEIELSRRPKTGGRRKGTPNRVTADVRQAFADLVHGNLDNVQLWLDRVAQDNPAKALELVLQLSRYVLPELKAVAVQVRPPPRDVRDLSYEELVHIIAETSQGKLSPSDVHRLSVPELERMAQECERLPTPDVTAQ